jgi:flagellar biosynthesis regulator FlaF
MHGMKAARAYQARSADRSLREQEADVFRRATAALRHAESGNELDRVRAVADNRLLWNTVAMTLKDPQNALPESLRGSIISVGLAVERELSEPEPDFQFVIGINEQITAGLAGA